MIFCSKKVVWKLALCAGAAGVLFLGAGCRLAPPLNRADLSEPGWNVRQGQAVWTRAGGGEGLAGDFLMATRAPGRLFVQFSKPPFPLVVAQVEGRAWEIQIPAENKRYSGYGTPPRGLVWFQVPEALAGLPAPPWLLVRGPESVRITHSGNGEALELFLTP